MRRAARSAAACAPRHAAAGAERVEGLQRAAHRLASLRADLHPGDMRASARRASERRRSASARNGASSKSGAPAGTAALSTTTRPEPSRKRTDAPARRADVAGQHGGAAAAKLLARQYQRAGRSQRAHAASGRRRSPRRCTASPRPRARRRPRRARSRTAPCHIVSKLDIEPCLLRAPRERRVGARRRRAPPAAAARRLVHRVRAKVRCS